MITIGITSLRLKIGQSPT